MKEMEALRAQLQQKEQALEDYKESDLYLPLGILGLLRDWTVPELLRERPPKVKKRSHLKDSVEPRVPQHRRYSLPFQYLTYSVTDE